MKILIAGTGGVGGYFGGRLARAGNDVTFFARGEHLRAIRENGLCVKSIKGDFVITSAKATDNIADVIIPDLILLGVKAWQVKEIAKIIKPLVGENTSVMPLQNGILAADELAEVIDRKNIIYGLCKIISKVESPGVINHFGVEPVIVFSEADNSQTERVKNINTVFSEAGISNKIAENIKAELWKKFIAICVSGLLAVTKTNYGEARTIPEVKELMHELLEEIYQISVAEKIELSNNIVSKTIEFINSYPADSTSSLTRDVWEGKPSEIEYQNGTVVKLGIKHNIPTPVNRFIYNSIIPGENKARRKNV